MAKFDFGGIRVKSTDAESEHGVRLTGAYWFQLSFSKDMGINRRLKYESRQINRRLGFSSLRNSDWNQPTHCFVPRRINRCSKKN